MTFEIAPKSTEIKVNWYDAKFYCFSLDVDGKTGWRLPTKEELNEIYQSNNDFVKRFYWSSTEYSTGFAWEQYLLHGLQRPANKDDLYSYVRAIRDI